jgi:hypothetical protein
MLNACLKSIYSNFQTLPDIYIITDHSLSASHCSKAISAFCRKDITIIAGSTLLSELDNENRYLLQFACQNPLGLKLAAILHVVKKGKPTLYCDTDVLWFKDPFQELSGLLKKTNFQMALSEDIQAAYDTSLIETCKLQELNSSPSFCSGILFIKRFEKEHFEIIYNLLPSVISQSTHFTEQTILAFLNKRCGNWSLDNRKFTLLFDDKQDFLPPKRRVVIARHYVGEVRHLMWRDAFFN